MKTLFHTPSIGVRGGEVALYDYAHFNETILGNESVIIYNANNSNNDIDAIKKFNKRFKVITINGEANNSGNILDLHKKIEEERPDFFYAIKFGFSDGIETKFCKTGAHVLFQTYDPHGDVYAYVSEWLAKKAAKDNGVSELKHVPFMVSLPEPNESREETRKKYGIPNDALLFGRIGGKVEFNISFAQAGVVESANRNKDVYFSFVNTDRFCTESNQIIHIDKIVDLQEKANWINACDCGLHGRQMGEGFGLANAEFCLMGKPVMSCPYSTIDFAHVDMLGHKGLWYTSVDSFVWIIDNFSKLKDTENSYKSLVSNYSPEKVMKKFKEVFYD